MMANDYKGLPTLTHLSGFLVARCGSSFPGDPHLRMSNADGQSCLGRSLTWSNGGAWMCSWGEAMITPCSWTNPWKPSELTYEPWGLEVQKIDCDGRQGW